MHPWGDAKKYFSCLQAKKGWDAWIRLRHECLNPKSQPPTLFPWIFFAWKCTKVQWSLPVEQPIPCMLATTLSSVSSQARHLKLCLKGSKQCVMGHLVTFSDLLKENTLPVIKEFSKAPNTPSLILKNRKVFYYLLTLML